MSTVPTEFEPFFAHARQGRLGFPLCGACGRFHWYPMPRCPHCRRSGWGWQRIAGSGVIHSLTVVRHAFDPSRREALPYVVGLVTFPDAPGVRLISNLIGAEPSQFQIGQAVEAVFPGPDAAKARVVFRPAPDSRSGQP